MTPRYLSHSVCNSALRLWVGSDDSYQMPGSFVYLFSLSLLRALNFFFLTTPHSMWDLSPPARDPTRGVLTTGLLKGSSLSSFQL